MPLPQRIAVARMPGSSIAAPAAAGWVTDFLNAAYFARPRRSRSVDDLRLAFSVLTTRWHRLGAARRLGARDVAAFHRAYALRRVRAVPRLTLDREQLLAGAADLLGPWFPDAVGDDARRAHGIAFETVEEREAFRPEERLRSAALGELTPPVRAEQRWSTYPPVPLPSAERALALLGAPERWPDFGAEGGRFTALRTGGLAGQTFEIEIVALPVPRARVHTRGYVTATGVLAAGRELDAWVAALATGAGEVVPAGGRALLGLELTTHAGHFLGRARSNLVVYADARGDAAIRDVGAWDPLPAELAGPYAVAGRAAQHAFWGPGDPDRSMLAQLALAAA